MNKIESITEDLITPIVEAEQFELVDIEFKKEGPHKYLRVYIDKPGGITLDDCQKVSEGLSKKLDEADPIVENYFLEVSSPGLDRPLKREVDFLKFKGEMIELKLYEAIDGQKTIEGELVGLIDDKIVIKISETEEVEMPREKVAITKLAIKF
ncbi:protein of unknown function DUF150 [Alkaliphilus metalliredigens QYMF]|uniref:Ribosome maturation factor RimP n=1 Tax=Alkaliphilus metalliredigens (strain QYMF) TaxID=293826 RepID=RIMP_ALKMQ|nr:ribosome maturation factor RimP [Alkaliphilus metalliredigens]A6TRL1.1 RecName: Full=Ribosome maturation factor RimP [Alkaliphilus metalliredigens QYMF]ABR48829.1 protein of unknown function DUF150 [Alkaliphilus metalliredigens QYMF]